MWKEKVKALKINIFAIYFASKDPRVPWYAKVLALCVVGYAFSPIDFIPDFIPILGYIDDFILLPIGIIAVLKLIPKGIIEEHKARAEELMKKGKPKNWIAAFIIIMLWLVLGLTVTLILIR